MIECRPLKHSAHGSHIARVPRANVRIEDRVLEHAFHSNRRLGVPLAQVSIELIIVLECAEKATNIADIPFAQVQVGRIIRCGRVVVTCEGVVEVGDFARVPAFNADDCRIGAKLLSQIGKVEGACCDPLAYINGACKAPKESLSSATAPMVSRENVFF